MKSKLAYLLLLPVAVLVIFLGFYRISSILGSFKIFVQTIALIETNKNAPYEEKMSIKYPVYFSFIEDVKSLTPEDSTIFIPQVYIPYGGLMWAIRETKVSAALLFPRQVKFYTENSVNSEFKTFIVITNGLPDKKIKAKKVYLIGKEIQEFPGDYDPGNFNVNENGLIEL